MTPVATEGTTYAADYDAVSFASSGSSGLREEGRSRGHGSAKAGREASSHRALPITSAIWVLYAVGGIEQEELATWQVGRVDRSRLYAEASGILSISDHRLAEEEYWRDAILEAWVERSASLDGEDDEPPVELSWVSMTKRTSGRPIRGPSELANLPRARPTVRVDFMPEDG